ncbi:VanW family protein [Flavobacterium sp. FlaQc-57]|uniref:VanW family protein n=1 Tax=Flavobacterium sp. FlaQc-57 TaxID=3374186 RepID=UPI00375840FF
MKTWKQIKINIKLLIRFKNDFLSKDLFKFSKETNDKFIFDYKVTISQKIMPSQTFGNKLYNIELASKRINRHILKPNQIFSFFKIIGNPNHGFKKSRTLVNGKLEQENGGGMCQVSGIVYQMSLITGLEILERHNHSVDIYTEETRFAPLGCDATIVYGYKDLRIKNNLPFPVKFEIVIIDNFIYATLLSMEVIDKKDLIFESKIDENFIYVNVLNCDKKVLNKSQYKVMNFE